jgi:hypothetical protein
METLPHCMAAGDVKEKLRDISITVGSTTIRYGLDFLHFIKK